MVAGDVVPVSAEVVPVRRALEDCFGGEAVAVQSMRRVYASWLDCVAHSVYREKIVPELSRLFPRMDVNNPGNIPFEYRHMQELHTSIGYELGEGSPAYRRPGIENLHFLIGEPSLKVSSIVDYWAGPPFQEHIRGPIIGKFKRAEIHVRNAAISELLARSNSVIIGSTPPETS